MIETKTGGSGYIPDTYVFNVRNHLDMWDTIRQNFKVKYKTALDVHSLPQLVFITKKDYQTIPSFQKNISDNSSNQLARTLARVFPMDIKFKGNNISTVDFIIDEKEKESFLNTLPFSGGASMRDEQVIKQLKSIEQKLDKITKALSIDMD